MARLGFIGRAKALDLQPLADHFAAKYGWSPEKEARSGKVLRALLDDLTHTLASRSYVYKGQCLPMYQRNDVWIAKPGPGGIPDAPAFPNPSQLPSPTPDLLNDPLFLIGAAAPLSGNVVVTAKVLRTVHGPVQAFATVAGQPVAYVRQRSTFFHEPDAAPSFLKMNSPDLVHDAASFQQAMGTVAN